MRRPRILFLSPRFPYPPWRGDQLRVYQLLKAVAEHAQVKVLSFGGADETLPLREVESRTVDRTPASRLAGNLSVADPATPMQVRWFLDRRMFGALAEELSAWRPDVLHTSLSRMAPYMRRASGCHRHLDLIDSMWLNLRTRSEASGPALGAGFALESRLAGAYEASVGSVADSVSVVAEADRLAPGLEDARVIPNGVDPEAFPYLEPDLRPPLAIFFGNLGYFHNVAPARFLAVDVLDRVRRASPGARARLAGARPAAALRRLGGREGVELVADPPRMVGHLHEAAVAVLPMFSGSGMKNKVLEAFCAGTPVVANALGMEGIDAVPGSHYLLAEGPEATAAAVLRLLGDPGERVQIARRARELAVAGYSWAHQADRMLDAYGVGRAAPLSG